MNKTNHLLLHRLLKGIADCAIKLFIPILIYNATSNIMLCFTYIIIDHFVAALCFGALKRIIQKQPLACLIISILPLIACELMLLLMQIDIGLIIGIAVLDAVYSSLYYGALNLTFANIDDNTNTAKFESGQHIGKIIFTILSAYLLGNLQNSFLFVVLFSVGLYLLSMIPIIIIRIKDKDKKRVIPKFDIKQVLSDTKEFNIYHIFTGIFSFICEFVLPLYLYINGLSLTVVGIFMALQYSVNILANYVVKFLQNKNKTKFIVISSSIIQFISLTCIIFFNNNIVIYIFNLLITFSYQMLFVSLFGLFVKDQKQNNMFYHSLFYRDIIQNAARTMSGCMYLIFPSFTVMFGLGLVSSILIGVSGTKCVNKVNKNLQTDKL